MKKYGRKMQLAGGLGLFWLAMASDGELLRVGPTLLLGGLAIGLLLLGEVFLHLRKRARRRAEVIPMAGQPSAASALRAG